MLSEEGLILVAVVVACGLVVLGALELVSPTRPRHPERRPVRHPVRRAMPTSRTVPQRPVARAAIPVAIETPKVVAPSEPIAAPVTLELPEYLSVGPAAPEPAPVVVAADPPAVDVAPPVQPLRIVASATAPGETARPDRPRTPRPRPTLRPVRPLARAAEAAPDYPPVIEPPPAQPLPAAELSPAAEPEPFVVDRGFALVESGRFGEAVSLSQAALEASKSAGVSAPTTRATQERARLWGVVGLGKAGLDDVEGARFAFEEAIALAPGTERLTWERHLVGLALTVGRLALSDVDAEPRPERIATLRSAMDWLERGLDIAPDDADLRATLTTAREALWPTHETIVRHLVQGQHFAEARRTLADLLADPECPPELQGEFRRLLGRAMAGEAAQATAEASPHLQAGRPDETMAALVRAQGLIEAIPSDALAPRRRQELERRIWAGYLALGTNRVDAGAPEAALDPLSRAASFDAIATERKEEARGLLVRALGEIVETRTAEITRLIEAGDRSLAGLQTEKLWSLLRTAVDQGVPEDLLAETSARVHALFEAGGAKRP